MFRGVNSLFHPGPEMRKHVTVYVMDPASRMTALIQSPLPGKLNLSLYLGKIK